MGGRQFAEKVTLAGVELGLNGVGVRSVAWVKGYAAGLYLKSASRSASAVLATPGPKRLQLVMLMDVPAAEFSKAVRGGIRKNSSEAEAAALQGPVQELCARIDALSQFRNGDVVDLDFIPDHGVTLTVNGRVAGAPIAAPELFAGVLKIFIGDKPVDASLKAGLLGRR